MLQVLLSHWNARSACRPSLRGWTARVASSARQGTALKAAKPTWRDMLGIVRRLHQPLPETYVGCLNEVLNAALRAGQAGELVEDKEFAALLKRVSVRLYGFSSHNTYLILATLVKLPVSQTTYGLLSSCLEQLREDVAALGDTELGHLALLLARIAGGRAGEAVRQAVKDLRVDYAAVLEQRAPQLSAKGLCLAVSGLAQVGHDCSESLVVSLGAAATAKLGELSPSQLPGLLAALASLGLRDARLFSAAALQLEAAAEDLAPKQLSEALWALAAARAPAASTPGLRRQSAATAHFCGPREALQALRALCALNVFEEAWVSQLTQRLSKLPRSSLEEAEDNGLHQVALSLKLEPDARSALAAVQSVPDLWGRCYQPAEVTGELGCEATSTRANGPTLLIADLAAARGWATTSDATFLGFYRVALLLETPGCRVAVDVDPLAQRWLSSPVDIWCQLKHRHLSLLGLRVIWVNHRQWDNLDAVAQRKAAEQWLPASEASDA
mmetsp:Transcript_110096/g.355338  ORF Transcript_110096/g.355338 Transcript_110096/m.355338 type:complete len:500 (-) Transcript_110096:111-1610(-)